MDGGSAASKDHKRGHPTAYWLRDDAGHTLAARDEQQGVWADHAADTRDAGAISVRAEYSGLFEPLNVAKALEVPAIMKRPRGITGDTAVHLTTCFNTTAEFWMNL